MQLHALLHKNCLIKCSACSNFIVVTKQEILVISLTDFFDAALRRHNDIIMLSECLVTTLFQQDSAPAHCAAHVQQLNWSVMKRHFFSCALPVTSKQPRSQSCGLRDLGCHAASCLYHRQIHSVDELKRRLIDVWCGLEQSIFDKAFDQWRERHRACIRAKGGHLEYSL